jgi:hypothetical protein
MCANCLSPGGCFGFLGRSASHRAFDLFGGPFCPRRELSHHVIEQRLAVFHVGAPLNASLLDSFPHPRQEIAPKGPGQRLINHSLIIRGKAAAPPQRYTG